MTAGPVTPRPDSILRSATFTVAARWTDRLIGITSTLILARLLAPDDFGLIAMASLAVGLADVLLDLGVNVALIQNRAATREHYDTAWTLRLIQTAAGTILLVAAAPLIAGYFQDARLEPVVQALACLLLLAGLENIGLVDLQKHMRFGVEFRFLFLRRLFGFAATILAAVLLRSYWALVIGTLAGRLFGVGLSYWLHPMRPRLSLARFREIFAISQWMLVRGLGNFLYHNLHKVMVGRWSSTGTMGAYSLADEIASMPAGELLAPLNRVLFPAFAAAKENPAELRRLFLLAQGVQTLLVVPATVGLALVAGEAVSVLLGEKWLTAVPFLQVLAIVSVVHALTNSGSYVLLALNRIRLATLSIWIEVGVIAVIGFGLLAGAEALEVAWLRLAAAGIGVGLSFWLVLLALPGLEVIDLVRNTIRPLLAAGLMVGTVLGAGLLLPLAPVPALGLKIGVGVLTYGLSVLLFWRLLGRPAGAESYLLDRLGGLPWRPSRP